MSHDVFISYSKADKTTADAACAMLEARGIRCWIAPRDVTPGVDWGEAIVKAISSCRVMVLVFSSHANESPQVRREVQRGFEKGRTVIPFRVEDVAPVESLEYYIGPVHWLDALTPPLRNHLVLLAEQVARILHAGASNREPDSGAAAARPRKPAAPDQVQNKVSLPPAGPRANPGQARPAERPATPSPPRAESLAQDLEIPTDVVAETNEEAVVRAKGMVRWPSALVIGAGILSMLIYLVTLPGLASPKEESAGDRTAFLICFVSFAAACFAVWGGVELRRLKNYRVAVAGTIALILASLLQILLCMPLLAAPVGLWAIVVLRRPVVRSAFTS
jgi:hypothetical protein